MSSSTPYVDLQRRIIEVLFLMAKKEPDYLRDLVERCRKKEEGVVDEIKSRFIPYFGVRLSFDDCEAAHEIILEQVDVSEKKISIRNLLGRPLHQRMPMSFDEYARHKGSGLNYLRTDRLSQPSALQEGDVLATGCRVLSVPREGGNGSVLLHLSGGFRGHWISVPSRIPIALLGEGELLKEAIDP